MLELIFAKEALERLKGFEPRTNGDIPSNFPLFGEISFGYPNFLNVQYFLSLEPLLVSPTSQVLGLRSQVSLDIACCFFSTRAVLI